MPEKYQEELTSRNINLNIFLCHDDAISSYAQILLYAMIIIIIMN